MVQRKVQGLRNLTLVAALLAALTGPPAGAAEGSAAKSWVLDADQGSGLVSFKAIGRPSALKIVGKGDAPKGKLTVAGGKVAGSCTFDLTSLDTGISMRNHHMKEKYLEVGKYPQAKLTITEMSLPPEFAGEKFSAEKVPFKGTLALHGVEKPVDGSARIERTADKAAIEAFFALKISDFAIPSPSFAGITMAEDVEVEVKTTAPLRSGP